MNRMRLQFALTAGLLMMLCCYSNAQSTKPTLLTNVTVIDGSGGAPKENQNVLIRDGKISSLLDQKPSVNAVVVDMKGKTIIPLLTNVHGHLGMAKGTKVAPENFTRDQITKELDRYLSYGVGTVVSMGTDKEIIFDIKKDSHAGKISGATVFTAGFGFRPPLENNHQEIGMESILRPATPAEAIADVKRLAAKKPDMIKIWVDDNGGTSEKIKPDVYQAIITEAHKHGIRVAAHLYYLQDAHLLLDAGVDIFAHSIRDKEVDDALIAKMKSKGTVYIPTLTRDGYEFFYGEAPTWINDPFFKASLEPGVFEMITDAAYRERIRNSPRYQSNKDAYQMALRNLKKIHDSGVLVALGTDSGAQPIRAQGFSEHLELQLMVDAGLTPLQVITIATRNACQALKLKDQGILAPGMRADFIVLKDNPSKDIKATQSIESIWKDGVKVK
jgi:imidazolonepropionase-like amidohydrolase